MNMVLRKLAELKLLPDIAEPFSAAMAADGSIPACKAMPACTIETILSRAETVRPLLEEILGHSPPHPYWGINE